MINMLVSAARRLLNLTKSAGFRTLTGAHVKAEEMYTHQLNAALTKLTSGAFSYRQACEDAVRELGKSGLRTVEFASGVTRQMDTAVRNAVRTTASQLAGEITMMNVKESDTNHVEVSAHWGAREGKGHANHIAWQGKIYCVEGTDGIYPNLEEATGYPSDPLGLKGYNCGHDFYPFWVGIDEPTTWPPVSPPVTVNGKTYTYYQATQEQRRREREIRNLKRNLYGYEAAGMSELAQETKSLIRTKTTEYKKFSQAVNIRAKLDRLRVCEPLKVQKKSDTMRLQDADVPKSLGAKTLNYDIEDKATGIFYRYAEGTKIRNREVFAGYGTNVSLHEGVAEGLTRQYGGTPEKWQHVKGIGVIDDDGEEVRAEVHWFQEESVGQVKHKIKKWLE